MKGLLLFAHGARDERWREPFDEVLRRVRAQAPGAPAQLCFLEFMTPGLLEGGAQLAAEGCTQVEVVPLFLGAGGHVRRDLPELLETLSAAHPGVRWTLRPAVGEMAGVIDAMALASVRWLGTAANAG